MATYFVNEVAAPNNDLPAVWHAFRSQQLRPCAEPVFQCGAVVIMLHKIAVLTTIHL